MSLNFALLGGSPSATQLAAAVATTGHTLAWIAEPGSQRESLQALAPRARWDEPWETLLDTHGATGIDVVIVGPGDDEEARSDHLRKLIGGKAAVLVAHPVNVSMLFHYELEMIQHDVQGVLRHYTPGRDHPAIQELATLVAQGEHSPIGQVEQARWQRALADRSQTQVLSHLARDLELLTCVGGRPERVGTLGAVDDSASYANLAVQTSGQQSLAAHWSVEPIDQISGARLTLLGSRGRHVLEMPDSGDWTLTLGGEAEETSPRAFPGSDAQACVEAIVQAVTAGVESTDWEPAAFAVELTDATMRSMKKGRTIELHGEEYSEAATFKGMMTSLGCGLIVAVIPGLMIAGLIGDALGLGTRWLRYWPYGLLAVMSLFLAAQAASRFVLPAKSEQSENR